MASIDSCKYDIRRYNNIKANIQNIINYLNNYNTDCEDLVKIIKNNYSVDSEEPNLLVNIQITQGDVQKTSNYLKNTIIPAINNEIYSLNRKISQLKAAEVEND